MVVYPNNFGLPDVGAVQGNFVVSGGSLGWIDTKKCAVDAGVDLLTSTTFTVTLRVFATDGSELQPPCTTTFTLSVNEVYIKRVSTPWSVDFSAPDEPLRVANSAAAALATVGGGLHVRGAANVYGCTGEKIKEYTIWAIPDATFTFPQPPAFSAVVPGADWVLVRHIEFAAQTIAQPVGPPINYTADQVRAYNILDGDPQPNVLTNVWTARSECICVHVDATLVCTCWNVPSLEPSAFDSNSLPKLNPVHQGGTGKFTFLLQVIDTTGNTYYDVQRAWVDNEPIKAAIIGIGGQAPCADLYTQTSAGVFKTVNIQGYAWDQLIEPPISRSRPATTSTSTRCSSRSRAPRSPALLTASASPVPARPLPLAVDTISTWNLQSVDAASNPDGAACRPAARPGAGVRVQRDPAGLGQDDRERRDGSLLRPGAVPDQDHQRSRAGVSAIGPAAVGELEFWPRFVLSALATWRASLSAGLRGWPCRPGAALAGLGRQRLSRAHAGLLLLPVAMGGRCVRLRTRARTDSLGGRMAGVVRRRLPADPCNRSITTLRRLIDGMLRPRAHGV